MIAHLSGQIKFKTLKTIILDVGGVGYELRVGQPVLERLKTGEQKDFFTHLHVREDVMELYGFETEAEKKFFELLISVSGVGSKSALQVLSIAKINEIQKAILRGDPTLLKKVSGIGQKTAERIVVDLKNKIDNFSFDEKDLNLASAELQAFEALQSLGYSNHEVRQALSQIPPEITNENEIIKLALKLLGKNKK